MKAYSQWLLVSTLTLWSAFSGTGAVLSTNLTLNADDVAYERQDLVVSNCTVTIDGRHQFSSLRLIGGAVVTHSPATPTEAYSLSLTIDNILTIDATSKIDVSGCGYGQGRTVGNSTAGGATGESGGSYGGLGIPWDGGANTTYGDYRDPQDPGSGGGSSYSSGAGGGLVRITAGSAQLDGLILANGTTIAGYNGGGGSGGGILLRVGTLSGAGRVAANGGDSSFQGGGGGGRVALYFTTLNTTFDTATQVTAHGGTGQGAGSVGTVYLKPAGALGQLLLANHGQPTGLWTPLGGPADTVFEADRLVLDGPKVVAATAAGAPIHADAVSVLEGAALTHPVTTADQLYTLQMTVTNALKIDAASKIDVSARGYPQGRTTGNTRPTGATGESGGSYGGLGVSYDGTANPVYGDFRDPREPGAGGGSSYSSGAGGGLIRITAGSVQVEGAILANGGTVAGYNGGGGSGGGILLKVGTLSGSGLVAASGGDSSYQGGGGGGRVAIYYTALSGFDAVSRAQAHGGVGGGAGAVGTVYLRPDAGPEELRLANHSARSGLWTPLGTPDDTVFRVDRLIVVGTNIVAATLTGVPIEAQAVSVLESSVLTHPVTTSAQVYSLGLTVRDELVVDASSRIDVSGRGYAKGRTFGNTTKGGATGESGGSYGGLGYPVDGSQNATYGDYRDPREPGSGGGSSYSSGAGGGLIRITAGNTRLEGAILANGVSLVGDNGGGGSGGGIFLTTVGLSGRGLVSASGGSSSYHGGGGGGRVAIYYTTLSGFDATTQAVAHAGGAGPRSGAVGTVYLQAAGAAGELRLANHGSLVGMWTPLGNPDDKVFSVDRLVMVGTNVVAAAVNGAPIEAQAVSVLNGSVLTHPVTTPAQALGLRLTVRDGLTIDENSRIDVSGRGYGQGRTLGNTTAGGATGESGGSYGGLGAAWDGNPNATYGDYHDPQEWGSGGGSSYSSGAGGGLIRITAGSAQIDGAILANGVSAVGYNGGGGSGGGIYLSVGKVGGRGLVSASGGSSSYHGGGSGGRVAVYYTSLNGFDAATQVVTHGGEGGHGTGAVGTVYLKAAGTTGELRLVSHGTPVGTWTPLGSSTDAVFQAESVILSGAGMVVATLSGAPLQAQSISLLNGAVLTHPVTTTTETLALRLNLSGKLTIDATSKIDVSGRGYTQGRTSGNTVTNGATGESGGAYGGLGAYWDGAPNPVYGDYRDPQEPGSGGGRSYSSGAGGGLIRISAESAQVDGAILANGVSAVGYNGGGGSGGGILLKVGELSGGGRVAADGGESSYQGGGGGGRVAIYYKTCHGFDPATQVTTHAGPGPSVGAVGTVYLKQDDVAGTLLLSSHGGRAGVWTPLGVANDGEYRVELLVVSGTNVVVAPEHEMAVQAQAISLLSGAVMTHRTTTADAVYSLRLTIVSNLLIDASAKIDVSGRGYLQGRTTGNSRVQGATGESGGSYGGLGTGWDGQPNPVYGDAHNPQEPGSGGGSSYSSGSGGGLVRITAGSAQIDGAILAQGTSLIGNNGGGGSGGGILLNVGALQGSGQVAADGGASSSQGGGGGGRVAVYSGNGMTLPDTNVTAKAGLGARGPAQPGTVVTSAGPYFAWQAPDALLHGSAPIAWYAFGADPFTSAVDLYAFRAGSSYTLATGADTLGGAAWDTTGVPDGVFELYAVWRGAGGETLASMSRTVLVNNSVVWHAGTVAASEVWSADRVHVVEADLVIPAGVTVTIQPGTVVKFAPGKGIVVAAGGILNALATAASPIIFTSLADDTAGGDSNLDGDGSRPQPGDWQGISLVGDGQFNPGGAVEFRYLSQTHGGTLLANQAWPGEVTHIITSELVVPSGVTLNINPGAVVKFAAGVGLTVQAGGTLNAPGTVAEPITFTSLADDTVGGDSNRDGDETTPAPGDWRSIRLDGAATGTFHHARIRYGGNSVINQWTAGGMIENTSGTLTVDACVVSGSLKDGILSGGTAEVFNSVVSDTGRGVTAWGNVTIRNCTVDNNGQGVVEHGGTLVVRNSIVSNNREVGVLHDWGSEHVTITYSDVWNPGAENYRGTADASGRNGNLAADPSYRDAAAADYRLGYVSPAIDAAEGAWAPAIDFMGAPRYDDPRTPNTGTAMAGSGAVPDMGAFEFVETAVADVDLEGRAVVGPRTLVAGQTVTLEWEVVNLGSGQAHGPWHDAIELRSRANGQVLLPAGEALVGQGVVLGPGQVCAGSATVRVPGGVEGPYFWQVRVNHRGEVFEGANWTNNVASASVYSTLTVPALTLDGATLTNRFTTAAQPFWFKFVAPASVDYVVSLDLVGAGATEMYAGQGYLPSAQHFDFRQTQWNIADSSVVIPAVAGQTYYLTAQAVALPGGPADFTVRVRRPDFAVTAVSPGTAGNVGCVTFEVYGSQFAAGDVLEAQPASGTTRQAIANQLVNSALTRATFDLRGAPAGVWDLRVRRNGAAVALARAFTVQDGGGASAWASVIGRGTIRTGRKYDYEVTYGNNGNVDADLVVVVTGIPAGAQVQPGSEFVATPWPAKLTSPLPLYYQSGAGIVLTRLMAPAMRPGDGGSASFSLTVSSTAAFEIQTWTFAANTAPGAYVASRIQAAGLLSARRPAARAAGAGGCVCNDELELLALDRLVQCAQENWWNNNFATRVAAGQNCVETADDMIDNQFPKWVKDHNTDNVFCGWKAQRVTHSSALESTSEYLSSWHTTVLLISPCGRHWVLDDYMTGAVLIEAYEDGDGNYLVDASSGFLLTKGLAGVHGMAYDNLWKPTSDPKPLDSLSTSPLPSSGGGSCSIAQKSDGKGVKPQQSADPNVKIGPTGGGALGALAQGERVPYQIYFENKAAATAPAQEVRVTDQLSANLDWATFELGRIGFNGVIIEVPPGVRNFTTNVNVSTDPNPVKVTASLDPNTGVATWYMMSMDPVTGELVEDPIAGFLPPNNAAQQGVGFVTYVIEQKAGLVSGQQIINQASIVFDVNAPILTPTVTNQVDYVAPTSRVQALPTSSPVAFDVSWSGTDDAQGSGVASYDLYVATDGGAFVPWLAGVTANHAAFSGQTGLRYSFFCLARDYAGNVQASPVEPYASTTVTTSATVTSLRAGPEMKTARMGHYIQGLADGGVVVLGGHGLDFVSLNSVEIWHPADLAFSLVNGLSTFDAGALVRLGDGRYLMAGGSANLGVAPGYNTVQIFDPASGAVTSAGVTMVRPRMQCRGAVLSGGQVLIVGGWYDNASATYGELYDPATGKVTATGALRTPRAMPGVFPTADGKAVIAGGWGVYGTPGYFEQVELYDPAQNAFTVLANTLFAGETGWALNANIERVIADQRAADGRYVMQASRTTNGVTEVVLALFDPVSLQFAKLAMSPAFTEAVSAWPPVVSALDHAAYFIAGYTTNNAANLTFRIQRVDLASGQRTASDWLGVTNYYPGSSATALLSGGRLLVTGGTTRVDSRANFTPVKQTFFVEGLPGSVAPSSPSLAWTRVGRALTLSWPSASSGYLLESADRLTASPAWTIVANPVVVAGERNTVTVDLGATNRFFRLRKP